LNQGIEGLAKCRHATLSVSMNLLAILGQLLIPGRQLKAVHSITPEQAIAVFETSLRIFPNLEKTRFHVKHQPVHKLASHLWASFQQLKGIRVDNLNRQIGCQSCS